MNHTPGPWTLVPRDGIFTPDGERLLVSGVALPTGNHPQAKEAEANARLIAAAPELLATLTDLVVFTAAMLDEENDAATQASALEVVQRVCLPNARAAIKKAKP